MGTVLAPSQQSGTTAKAGASSASPAPAVLPFRAGAYEVEFPAFDTTVTLSTSQQLAGPFDIPSGGYLRSVLLLVSATTAGNAAATAFKEDGPWNVLDNVTLLDTNGSAIVGPFGGFDLFLAHLFGGYAFDSDPTRSPSYTVTTGAGATGGSFAFIVRVPLEAVGRDAIGAIPNGDSSATLKLRYSVGPSTTVYSTSPTALPNVRVQAVAETWSQPAARSPKGMPQAQTPPGLGTLQQWSKTVPSLNSGANVVRLTRVGNYLRTLVLVVRDTTPARSGTLISNPLRILWEGMEWKNLQTEFIRHYMQERYGYTNTQLNTGVYVFEFSHDFDGHPGGELRDLWVPTAQGTRMEFQFTTSAAGTLTILTNDVSPSGDDVVS